MFERKIKNEKVLSDDLKLFYARNIPQGSCDKYAYMLGALESQFIALLKDFETFINTDSEFMKENIIEKHFDKTNEE